MIIVQYYHPLEMLPPGISLIRMLKDMGENVAYVGVHYADDTERVLKELNVPYMLYQRWPVVRFRDHPFWRLWFVLTKFYRRGRLCRLLQHLFLLRAYKRFSKRVGAGEVVVWSVNKQIAELFGPGLVELGKRHVLWLTEYGEKIGEYANAVLIESEINRARLLQKDLSLKELPFVLPNKPYKHPRRRNLPVADPLVEKNVRMWKDKTVFLYQGSLGNDRRGIVDMIEWICEEFPDCVMAVMSPWSPIVESISSRHENFSYVPFVAPPHHLEVTSRATIGLAVYTADQVAGISPLNGLYCAPNKTFEYTGFGIPLLCNNPPGLVDSVGKAGAAVCLPELSREQVLEGARELMTNYEDYTARAKVFFESVDMEKIVRQILSAAH